jgi:hypothetical protein
VRRRPKTTLALALVLALPATAQAQERGVHVDPDSPAGKEYAIPIDKARRDASGGGSTPFRSAPAGAAPMVTAAPLFGQGIKRQPPKKRARRRATAPRTRPRAPAGAALVSQPLTALDGTSAGGWTAGIIAGVILAGALLGLSLRAGMRRTQG